jgi:TonB family protein
MNGMAGATVLIERLIATRLPMPGATMKQEILGELMRILKPILAVVMTVWLSAPLASSDSAPDIVERSLRGRPAIAVEVLTGLTHRYSGPYFERLFHGIEVKALVKMPAEKKGQKTKVAVRFKIGKNGRLVVSSLFVETGSGEKSLDDVAIEAIRASAPFEPIPASLGLETLEVRCTFYYGSRPPSVIG